MNDAPSKALLPAGLSDLLPPQAQHEAETVEALLASCRAHGYERVKPPLVEFEEGLAGGEATFDVGRSFRMMDPVSQRMMGVRADMTMQIARIATTRLAKAPRPVRLCYAGEVLRVQGTQLSPERQFCQVGAELIGAAQAAAGDAEVVLLAAEALNAIGITELSIDLTLPTLVPAVADGLGIADPVAGRLRAALDRKDAAAVAAIEDETKARGLFRALLAAAGPADRALAAIAKLKLPKPAAEEAKRLAEVVELIVAARPDLRLTVDPVENRGFEYHTGVTFTIFAQGVRGELGGGGRYLALGGAEGGEPATGFTLFTNVLLRALATPEAARRVFVPLEVARAEAARLRAEGWITVAGLMPAKDAAAEARRLGCGHVYRDGQVKTVG
ncbi:MAG: ATP phosphoribosyltransferase regulatory subunit [Alphaproteobacteria bacterium]|nr:ATP phosphoribosyltransferase regulatory subunit [Alphaproteobacteria bacterium]